MVRLPILLFLLGCALFSSQAGFAQDRCGVVAYDKMLQSANPKRETEAQFEQWMQQRIADGKLKKFETAAVQSPAYVIPVVVHVIHNGTSDETNISNAQIQSQINVLNKDYKRQNTDASSTPAEFQPVAGSIDIQFVLAPQDPEGLPTNGITRTQGTKTSWDLSDNATFKALSYWPAEDYLNIWVIKFSSASGIIGYAQLPLSSSLQGLENASGNRLTDGVAVNYKDFGSNYESLGSFNLDAAYDRGRTASHEVGHFLGLRHIWGDGTCATDYVDDTPYQSSQTTSCPSSPVLATGCSQSPGNRMFQNYMDYTCDLRMNLFTQGQISRMVVVLGNSPRRTSLLTSHGSQPPVSVANDLGIRKVVAPLTSTCNSPVTPKIEIRNYGSNAVTSAQIQLSLGGSPVGSPVAFSLNLPDSTTKTTLSFNPVTLSSSSAQISFAIVSTNGGPDGNPANDSKSVQVSVPSSITLPILEPFNSVPPGWSIVNPDGNTTWANITAPNASTSNKAMYMNLHDYQNDGELDWLVTPSFTIDTPPTSLLKFDRAYAQFPGENGDELMVYALPGCSPDLTQGILLFDKAGSALSTATSTSNAFTPSSAGQWKSEAISLSGLTAGVPWQIAFITRNGYGNNIYVDNAIITNKFVNDIGIAGIESPGIVHCQTNPSIKFSVKNFSTSDVISFDAELALNGATPTTQSFTNILLAVGDQQVFTLNPVTLKSGSNQLTLTLNNPNGAADTSPTNNTLSFTSIVDQSTDSSPLRMTLDNPAEIVWITASEPNAKQWEKVSTNANQSLEYKAFTNTQIGDESWFVSPQLDLTRSETGSMFFDLSYAQRAPAAERLRILGSTDCGVTYKTLLFDQTGDQFSITSSSSSWIPATKADWRREFVNLDTISGKNNVRLAFVVTNQNGNNLFLDNIELFTGDDPQPPVTPIAYQLYYSTRQSQSDLALTFNLPEKKDVRLQIFSAMGQVVADNLLPDTLNQTYYFDLSNQATGIYLFRLGIDNQVSTTKVFIGH